MRPSSRREERSAGTTEKYLRDVGRFARWLEGRPVTAELAAAWREHLTAQGYASVTVNSMISPLNHLFRFLGWDECRIKFLKIQRRMFRDQGRELTRPEYDRLLAAARRRGENRLALLMEAICSTGVRVSEVRYLTVEAARAGRAEVRLKGKIRTILLPGKLCRKLLKYAQNAKNRLRRDLSHQKREEPGPPADLGGAETPVPGGGSGPHQGVPPQPAAPVRHPPFTGSPRTLCAWPTCWATAPSRTTRIYLLTTGEEHARLLERLGLVS